MVLVVVEVDVLHGYRIQWNNQVTWSDWATTIFLAVYLCGCVMWICDVD